jgi:DNA polymerase III subunit delta
VPVLILAGEEDFELSRRLSVLKTQLLDPAWTSINLQHLNCSNLREIMDAAASVPFGPGNRLIVVDRCDLFTKKRAREGTTGSASRKQGAKVSGKSKETSDVEPEEFERALSSVHPQTYLIFSCPFNFDSTLRLAKAAAKVAKLDAFPREKYWPGSRNAKLWTWCQKEAKSFGATIEDEAIQYLLDSTEGDLRQISSEIQKAAITALPKTHITLKLIVQLSPHHSNVFILAEHWLTGSGSGALIALDEVLSQQSAIPIVAALQTLLSKWIKMKVLCETYNNELPSGPGIDRRELPLAELSKRVAAELKLMPFVVEREMRKIVNLTSDSLIAKREELTRLEYLLKSGQIPDRHALELFVHAHP